jgi:hypothetical protein
MIKPVKNHLILTIIISALALYGELTALVSFHAWIELEHNVGRFDSMLDTALIAIFIGPLIYYFFVVENALVGSVTDNLTRLRNRTFLTLNTKNLSAKGSHFN